MARHRVPVQALRNFMSILFGFAMGGLNNLVILPWAFAGDFSTWGLVRFSAAWATALGPILAFGSSSSMNRFKGRCGRDGTLPQLYGTLAQPGLLLFSVLIVVPALLFPETTADLFGLQGNQRDAVRPIALLTGLQTAQIYFIGFLTSRLKTALATFAKETLFKVGYLLLALAVGYGIVTKPQFLPAFIGLYVVVLAVLVAQAVANRFRIDLRGLRDREFLRSLRRYSGTMILGNSAWVILNQIDIIMVGRLMSTEWVPLFAIASFIAAVTQIPQRAITRLWQPLIAEAMDRKDHGEAWRLVRLNHRTLLLTSGWILACITACLPELDHLLPDAFHGLGAVIFTVGCFRVMQGSAAGSSILIGQSDHFRWLIALNWTMVALAIPLNLLFIPDSGLGLGLHGAALATLIAMGTSITFRQWVVWRIWKRFTPDLRSVGIVLCLAVPAGLLMVWTPGLHPLVSLFVKSVGMTLWVAGAARGLNLAPEATAFLVKSIGKSSGDH